MTKHLIIPDTQIKSGVPTNHIAAAGRYAAKKKPDVIVMLGDWWDMPSLSSYENKGSKFFHNQSYAQDISAGNSAMTDFITPILDEQVRISNNKKKAWNPRMVFLIGNHEHRINRAVHNDPVLAGTISFADFELSDWEVHNYQVPVVIDGIAYCHNFVNPDSLTKNVIGGTIENKLSKIKRPFVMGHQQRRQFGQSYDGLGNEIMGMVVGRFYQHEEHYMGPQGQSNWSGIVMLNEVEDGRADPMFISEKWLVNNYG